VKEREDGVDVLPVPAQQIVSKVARGKDHGAQIDLIWGLVDWLRREAGELREDG
jgi:hypothetical protein